MTETLQQGIAEILLVKGGVYNAEYLAQAIASYLTEQGYVKRSELRLDEGEMARVINNATLFTNGYFIAKVLSEKSGEIIK